MKQNRKSSKMCKKEGNFSWKEALRDAEAGYKAAKAELERWEATVRTCRENCTRQSPATQD